MVPPTGILFEVFLTLLLVENLDVVCALVPFFHAFASVIGIKPINVIL